MLKNPPAMQETQVQSLGQEDPLKKGMAVHSSILAWRIPWTEEPGRLQSMGSQRVRHDWTTNSTLYRDKVWYSNCPTRSVHFLGGLLGVLIYDLAFEGVMMSLLPLFIHQASGTDWVPVVMNWSKSVCSGFSYRETWMNFLASPVAVYSNILAWKIIHRGAWRATVHGAAKS